VNTAMICRPSGAITNFQLYLPAVYWLTQDFNTEARHLYDRIGVLTSFIKYVRPA